ncbi:branched-chain amino acid ABC transporter permease [Variovorax sp. LT1R16]|uniref:branched-chain amino acid ABC transporter permease n=1 Tax=Variovorax sp. LT1R16 TaxID=3443728 RepID=UPI003F463E06
MDFSIASLLLVDGAVNGAVYALMAIAIILVFTVTRVLFIAQGEFVVFGVVTLAQLQVGKLPSAVWLVVAMAAACLVQEVWNGLRNRTAAPLIARACLRVVWLPVLVTALAYWLAPMNAPLAVQVALTIAIITPLGSMLYRLVYRSLADSTVLTLLIVSVGVHFALTSLALAFFGPEGFRTPSFFDATLSLGELTVSSQSAIVIGVAAVLIGLLFWLFTRTFRGMSLRATAVNQLGARIVGISAERAGMLSFALAAGIGALSGVLIGPTTTVFYDTGFLIGLKGFIAAVFAGLASFPGALVGSIVVGLLESFGSFWASAFKDSIVFAAIIPILLWRSMLHQGVEEH